MTLHRKTSMTTYLSELKRFDNVSGGSSLDREDAEEQGEQGLARSRCADEDIE